MHSRKPTLISISVGAMPLFHSDLLHQREALSAYRATPREPSVSSAWPALRPMTVLPMDCEITTTSPRQDDRRHADRAGRAAAARSGGVHRAARRAAGTGRSALTGAAGPDALPQIQPARRRRYAGGAGKWSVLLDPGGDQPRFERRIVVERRRIGARPEVEERHCVARGVVRLHGRGDGGGYVEPDG